jgi:hypothetical protein
LLVSLAVRQCAFFFAPDLLMHDMKQPTPSTKKNHQPASQPASQPARQSSQLFWPLAAWSSFIRPPPRLL